MTRSYYFAAMFQAENRTGDFLALLYRKGVDSSLADVFASNWKSDGKKRSKKNPIRESASGIPRRFRVDNKEITIMKTGLLIFSSI